MWSPGFFENDIVNDAPNPTHVPLAIRADIFKSLERHHCPRRASTLDQMPNSYSNI